MTLEKDYQGDVAAICERHPAGSEERRLAKAEAWDRFDAKIFERNGRVSVIERCQRKFAGDYLPVLQSRYQGTVDDGAYQLARIGVFRAYAQRLFELDLLTAVFDDDWIARFAEDSLAEERRVLPIPRVPRTLTEADLWLLCNPLRRFSWQFFEAVHTEFGIGRLASEPEIFDGVAEQDRPEGLPTGETAIIR